VIEIDERSPERRSSALEFVDRGSDLVGVVSV
jgi:hypothetical protein